MAAVAKGLNRRCFGGIVRFALRWFRPIPRDLVPDREPGLTRPPIQPGESSATIWVDGRDGSPGRVSHPDEVRGNGKWVTSFLQDMAILFGDAAGAALHRISDVTVRVSWVQSARMYDGIGTEYRITPATSACPPSQSSSPLGGRRMNGSEQRECNGD